MGRLERNEYCSPLLLLRFVFALPYQRDGILVVGMANANAYVNKNKAGNIFICLAQLFSQIFHRECKNRVHQLLRCEL